MLFKEGVTVKICPSFIVRASQAALAALGLATLACWWAGRGDLTQLGAGYAPASPESAASFVLVALTLRCLEAPCSGWRLRAAQATALVMLAAGVTSLAGYLGASVLPVHAWIALRRSHAVAPVPPAAYSSVSLIAAGAGPLTIDARGRRWGKPSDAFALVSASIGLLALASYGYGVEYFHVIPAFGGNDVSVISAIGQVLVGLALLCARPEKGLAAVVLSPRIGGLVARRLLVSALLIVPLLAAVGILGSTAKLYPSAGAVELTMFSALVVIVTSALTTARLLDHIDARRERAERGLRVSEERLRELIQDASDGIFIADVTGHYVEANTAACRMVGYSREEILGKRITDLIPKEDAERLWKTRERLLEGGMHVGEWTLLRRDGRELPVEVSAKIMPDGRWQALVRDISERKRQEEARFHVALESAANAMLVLDEDRRVRSLNRQAAELFRYQSSEMYGLPIDALVPAQAEGRNDREQQARRKDGSRFPAQVGVTRLDAPDGALTVVAIVDVSERKRSEKALKDSEARLRRTVADLEAFAYTVSHNLRSPLRAVEGYADLAERRLSPQADEQARSLLSRIRTSALRLDRLIRDLLAYSSISRAPLATQPVDLDAAVSQAIEQEAPPGRARLHVRSPLGRVFAQESLLLQALANLVANAVKFVPSGRAPEIEIRGEPASGGRLRLIVEDNGIGIAPEQLAKIFEPFERLHGTDYEGTGIGLAIVRKAVERMGGSVGVESQPGRGSRFWLELPKA